jgi:hypothetical protein
MTIAGWIILIGGAIALGSLATKAPRKEKVAIPVKAKTKG